MASSRDTEEQLLRDRAETAYALARKRVFDVPGYPDVVLSREQVDIIVELEQAEAQLKAHREAGFPRG